MGWLEECYAQSTESLSKAGKRIAELEAALAALLRAVKNRSAGDYSDLLDEVLDAEAVLRDGDHPPAHTHPCPTCRAARPCTATGCADGPRECATCSQCRGW